jgi:hypothetical protein
MDTGDEAVGGRFSVAAIRVKDTELMSLTHRENGAITIACQFVEPR